eukprot:m.158991 g.158991  ORF g.158991 m.158991 type:complete len:105 (-) comp13362_c0_seq10:60-374(-)
MKLILDCNPCVLPKYIVTHRDANSKEIWMVAFELLEINLKDEVHAVHHDDFLAAYRGCLREASIRLGMWVTGGLVHCGTFSYVLLLFFLFLFFYRCIAYNVDDN